MTDETFQKQIQKNVIIMRMMIFVQTNLSCVCPTRQKHIHKSTIRNFVVSMANGSSAGGGGGDGQLEQRALYRGAGWSGRAAATVRSAGRAGRWDAELLHYIKLQNV